MFLRKSAPFISFPGGFVVLMRRYSARIRWLSRPIAFQSIGRVSRACAEVVTGATKALTTTIFRKRRISSLEREEGWLVRPGRKLPPRLVVTQWVPVHGYRCRF